MPRVVSSDTGIHEDAAMFMAANFGIINCEFIEYLTPDLLALGVGLLRAVAGNLGRGLVTFPAGGKKYYRRQEIIVTQGLDELMGRYFRVPIIHLHLIIQESKQIENRRRISFD